ncbi:hypothetical protein PIROE2DRAFT_65514 [Piromyces sp. E2]|nr:hypothetical protein PIROE2DRAFT_65514 [Piromyces sp. E2]|eukprot:OUM56476.1 hypothetical protein PIROE2DRAFT_65514 [Piromyces sp. E2]
MGYADREIHIQKKGSSLRSLLQALLFVFVGSTVIVCAIVAICLIYKVKPGFNNGRIEELKSKQIDMKTAWIISIPQLIIYSLIIYVFYKKRNHYLINFRPLTLCMLSGICTTVYCVLLPIFTALQGENKTGDGIIDCKFNMIFTDVFATMSMMTNISRYFKLYLLNRRDIGKMKLYNDKYDSAFPGKEESVDSFEPNAYVKRINKLVSKRITIIFFVLPYLILITVGVIIIKINPGQCESSAIIYYIPVVVLSTLTLFLIPFFLIELTKSKAINRINQLDMVISYFTLYISILLFIGSLFYFYRGKNELKSIVNHGLVNAKSSSLFFIIPSCFSLVCALVIPLIEAHIADKKLKKKKFLSKKDFTRLLMGNSYIEALKSVAVRSYCVETVIFWEMHMKLMKIINNDEETKQHRASIEQHLNQKRIPSVTNTAVPPMSPNYDLLLGLNKNIFGSNNNEILYTGSFGEEIDPKLINAINYGTEKSVKDYYSENKTCEESRINIQGYMNTNPSVHFSQNNTHHPNNYNRRRDDSVLSLSTNNSVNQNYNNYYIDTVNSDQIELLKNHDMPYSPRENQNGYTANLNKGPAIRSRKNTIRNSETEIFYDLFEIDPENNEVPSKFWKDFENLYNSFISDQSLATVNLDTDTVNRLKRSLKNKDYTKDMFFPAVAETVELIYQNLYPKLLAR